MAGRRICPSGRAVKRNPSPVQRVHEGESSLRDGEVFRRALEAKGRGDSDEAAGWSTMLTDRKRRNLYELETADGGKLFAAFKPLIPLAALWADFQPGALNRVLPMRCREASRALRFGQARNCALMPT